MATTCKLIAKNVLGSDTASVTFSSIPGIFSDLLLISSVSLSSNDFGRDIRLSFNSATTNQSSRVLRAFNGTSVSSYTSTALLITDNALGQLAGGSTFTSVETYIPNYASTSIAKSISSSSVSERNATDGRIDIVAGLWNSTAAITSITLDSPVLPANLKSDSSFFLYGITKS